MAEEPDESNVQIDLNDPVTPLRELALEAHEIFLELKSVGFPDAVLAQIMANIMYDALVTSTPNVQFEIVDDDDDEEEDLDDERDD